MPQAPHSHADLFGDTRADSSALVTVDKPKSALSREQRSFNRLTEQIRSKRRQLADWQTWLSGYAQRIARECAPLGDRLRAIEVRIVKCLDQLLAPGMDQRLSRRQRNVLSRELTERLDSLLDGDPTPDPELEAMYARHAGMSLAESRRQDQAFEKDAAEAVLGAMFGEDAVKDHEAEDAESLFRHVRDKLGAQDAARPGRRQSKRADAAAERRQAAEREATQSVRDIFRKLASALHPDRETDPAERERKTALMQRVNQAYESNDLLQLLSLQIEIEQIDAEHLAGVPESRLKHYNAVLRDQLASLDAELDTLLAPVAMDMDVWAPTLRVADFEQALKRRSAELRRWCREAEAELESLDDPRRREAWIAALSAEQKRGDRLDFPEHVDDIAFSSDLPDPFGEPPADWPFPGMFTAAPGGGGRQQKSKRKKRKNARP